MDRKPLDWMQKIPQDVPVLIAGPTGSGKSGLALRLAEAAGGVVVNADALQVFANWLVLTARPGAADLARARHALYGHVGPSEDYSVGHWLREVAGILAGPERIIVTGGTGLYLSALTEGLAEIPPTPHDIRAAADRRIAAGERERMLAELDHETRDRLDPLNPVRVQRAWEVMTATGTGLATWQARTGAPLLALDKVYPILLDAPPDWLNPRLERRFDAMLAAGALDEARANLADWEPRRPSAKAIGGAELVAHLRGELALDAARQLAVGSTRQYAKRQRSWFRARMRDWPRLNAADL
jgi:tRNA dimethylallyltransferase